MGRLTLRILVVDDDGEQRARLVEALEADGHAVFAATSGGSAIELAKRELPDAVVLEIGLPDVNGFDVARQLRAECLPATSVILVVTGSTEAAPRDVEHLIDLHLSKPVEPALLSGLIHYVYDVRRIAPVPPTPRAVIGVLRDRRRR